MFIMKKAEMKVLFLGICGKNLTIKDYKKLATEFDKRLYGFLKEAFNIVPIDTLSILIAREIPYLDSEDIYIFIKRLYTMNNRKFPETKKSKKIVPKDGNEDLYIGYYKLLIDDKLDKKEFDKELKKFVKEVQKLKKTKSQRKGKKRTGVINVQ